MKLLCIERDAFSPPKLRVGDIYTYTGRYTCSGCREVWYTVIEIPTYDGDKRGVCPRCHLTFVNAASNWHFRARRFVPWNPNELGITDVDVKELYSPTELVR